jgi:hypothetical protein
VGADFESVGRVADCRDGRSSPLRALAAPGLVVVIALNDAIGRVGDGGARLVSVIVTYEDKLRAAEGVLPSGVGMS